MSAICAGTPFSTSLIAAANIHIVSLSFTLGWKVVGTCILRHTAVM